MSIDTQSEYLTKGDDDMNADFQPAATGIRLYPDGRMTAQDAATYCGISYKSLALQRSQGVGAPFVKLGKQVFYRMDDLDRWMDSCRVGSTAEYKARSRRAGLGGGAE